MPERDLFLKALDIPDPADRAAFLDRECAGNPELRLDTAALTPGACVDALLAHLREAKVLGE